MNISLVMLPSSAFSCYVIEKILKFTFLCFKNEIIQNSYLMRKPLHYKMEGPSKF